MNPPAPAADYLQRLRSAFSERIPHVQALAITVAELSADSLLARLPYQPHFLVDVERRIIHTGVVTTLIDTASGAALLARLGKPEAIATLDLRVDYLRPPRADHDLWCRAECTRITANIAFVRSRVWQTSEQEVIAESLATFMRNANEQQTP